MAFCSKPGPQIKCRYSQTPALPYWKVLWTEEGKKFYREKEGLGLVSKKVVRGDICFGQQARDKIVKSEEPIVVGDKKELTLYYTYKIENLAEWAKNPDIQRAFPRIVPTINGAGKTILNQALTLTSQGWEAQGLDGPS